MVAAFVLLASAPKEVESTPRQFLLFMACAFIGCVFMVLSMVASYQQEPAIRRVPVIGKLHRALIPKSTEWGEAVHIDFMAVATLVFLGVLLFAIGRF